MVSQTESNLRPRAGEADPAPKADDNTRVDSTGPVEGAGPEPFSEDDDLRAGRIDALRGETRDLLPYLSHDAFDGVDRAQAEAIQNDAEERAGWPEPVADAFRGICQLASRRTPKRSQRVL